MAEELWLLVVAELPRLGLLHNTDWGGGPEGPGWGLHHPLPGSHFRLRLSAPVGCRIACFCPVQPFDSYPRSAAACCGTHPMLGLAQVLGGIPSLPFQYPAGL